MMAELKGSTKQVAWAQDIREKFFSSGEAQKLQDTNARAGNVYIDRLRREESAKWWIDRRYFLKNTYKGMLWEVEFFFKVGHKIEMSIEDRWAALSAKLDTLSENEIYRLYDAAIKKEVVQWIDDDDDECRLKIYDYEFVETAAPAEPAPAKAEAVEEQQEEPAPALLTLKEAAEIEAANGKKYTAAYLGKLCRDGKLAGAVKVGRQWKVTAAAVKAYAPSRRGAATAKKVARARAKAKAYDLKNAPKYENVCELKCTKTQFIGLDPVRARLMNHCIRVGDWAPE